MAGCSDDNPEGTAVNRILFTVDSGDMNKVWTEGESLGLYGEHGGDNIATPYKNGYWIAKGELTIWDGANTVYAYYPYDTSVTDPREIPVTADDGTDYLYGKGNYVWPNNGRVTRLSVTPVLSYLVIKIKDEQRDVSDSIRHWNDVRVKEELPVIGTYDLYTGLITPDAYGIIQRDVNKDIPHNYDSEKQVTLRLIPPVLHTATRAEKSYTLALTIDGAPYTVDVSQIMRLMEPGEVYNISLTLNRNALEIYWIGIGQWDEVNQDNIPMGGDELER
jgi:hypothetical protein